MERTMYAFSLVFIMAFSYVMLHPDKPPADPDVLLGETIALTFLALVVVSYFRARNAGRRWVTWLVLVPYVNTLVTVYLLFAPPKCPPSSSSSA